jgi:hypothetical protein
MMGETETKRGFGTACIPTETLEELREFRKARGIPIRFQIVEGVKLFWEKYEREHAKEVKRENTQRR